MNHMKLMEWKNVSLNYSERAAFTNSGNMPLLLVSVSH
jgi:hypothetical protein